ncbi:hypothetical protein KIH23_13335 [Flavobacterium sp. CYK-55]|uniref:hypothetical protein n=1 Tax=Flavobacterium sp. CYK-55 TaxID=2835529 RepID=UPI001BCD4E89|nr:hypothetical protein [Flavobacterium sp. CYK-55]MBS7788285.1 hypothetical protein [Flavobacterium sp. CYK-55]
MEFSKTLEVLISIGLMYFLFSTLVSIIFEWYSYKTDKRGKFLHQTIHQLLDDPVNKNFGALIYSHFSIDKLRKDKNSYPQYISSEMFADALIDVVGTQSEKTVFIKEFDPDNPTKLLQVTLQENRITDAYERFHEAVKSMQYSPLKSQLRAFHEKTKDYNELKNLIAKWYDDYMARVTGWYKIKIKNTLLGISFLVCLLLNLDTLTLVQKLNTDDQLRVALVKQAEKMVDEHLEKKGSENDTLEKTFPLVVDGKVLTYKLNPNAEDPKYLSRIKTVMQDIEKRNLPVGYPEGFTTGKNWIDYLWWLLGIGISTMALSFGAPFWFEILVKAVNIRRAGNKPS